MALKVAIGYSDTTDTWAAIAAIAYARQMGAKVINMSFGSLSQNPAFQDAISDAYELDKIVLVASGGKGGIKQITYPAGYDGVIGVSATTSNDGLYSDSNWGSHIDLAAPGLDIYTTTVGGGDGQASGPSIAAAFVSGIAALIRSENPSLNQYDPWEVEHILCNAAEDKGATGWDEHYGAGRVNAWGSLMLARGYGDITYNMRWYYSMVLDYGYGDLTVASGVTLYVTDSCPYVTFKANTNPKRRLYVYGKLNAEGLSYAKIKFNSTSSSGANWRGIWFDAGAPDESKIKYCEIYNAEYGIRSSYTSPLISYDKIKACTYGIYLDHCAPGYLDLSHLTCENNTTGLYMNATPSSGSLVIDYGVFKGGTTGVKLYNYSSPIFNRNVIRDNTAAGLNCETYSCPSLEIYYGGGYNRITANTHGGVKAYTSSSPYIGRAGKAGDNCIYSNDPGFEVTNGTASTVYARYVYWGEPPHPAASDFDGTVDYSYSEGTCSSQVPARLLVTERCPNCSPLTDYESPGEDIITNRPGFAGLLDAVFPYHLNGDRQSVLSLIDSYIAAESDAEDRIKARHLGLIYSRTPDTAAGQVRELNGLVSQTGSRETKKVLIFDLFNIYLNELSDGEKARQCFDYLYENYPDDAITKEAWMLLGNEEAAWPLSRQVAVQEEKLSTALLPNYPNPFNPETEIQFILAEDTPVNLMIYNIQGRLVATLLLERRLTAGHHRVRWDGRDSYGAQVPSGIYFLRLQAAGKVQTRKMVVLK